MIADLDALDKSGLLLGTGYPTYRLTERKPPMPKTYVLRGEFSFYRSCACVYHEGRFVAPPNFDNMHSAAHKTSLEAMQQGFADAPECMLPDEPLCLLTASWSEGNIYHCYVDTIGKLSVLSQYFDIRGFTYLIPSTSKVTKEVFAILGLRTIEYDSKTTRYRAPDLTLASLPGVTSYPSGGLLTYLSELMRVIPASATKRNIYVKRTKRGIQNEAEFLDYMSRFIEFDVVSLEDLPLRDQIGLMRDTALVFGPHGAGFAHTIFKDSGALLDIFGPDFANPPYRNMHMESGIYYGSYYPADGLPIKYGPVTGGNILPNFTVDMERFGRFYAEHRDWLI